MLLVNGDSVRSQCLRETRRRKVSVRLSGELNGGVDAGSRDVEQEILFGGASRGRQHGLVNW